MSVSGRPARQVVGQAMKDSQFESMLTARQVADFLHVSISTVRRWSDKGMLKFYRIGSRGDRRYLREDVLLFLEESSGNQRTDATENGWTTRFNDRAQDEQ